MLLVLLISLINIFSSEIIKSFRYKTAMIFSIKLKQQQFAMDLFHWWEKFDQMTAITATTSTTSIPISLPSDVDKQLEQNRINIFNWNSTTNYWLKSTGKQTDKPINRQTTITYLGHLQIYLSQVNITINLFWPHTNNYHLSKAIRIVFELYVLYVLVCFVSSIYHFINMSIDQ